VAADNMRRLAALDMCRAVRLFFFPFCPNKKAFCFKIDMFLILTNYEKSGL